MEIFKVNCDIVMDFLTKFTLLFGIIKFLVEYRNKKKRDRIQYLVEFSRLYTQDEDIKAVIKCLEELEDDESADVSKIKVHQIEMFMRFFEELNYLIKDKAVDKKQVFYLFGYYTLILDRNHNKWPDLNYDGWYWKEFRNFVKNMNKYEKKQGVTKFGVMNIFYCRSIRYIISSFSNVFGNQQC